MARHASRGYSARIQAVVLSCALATAALCHDTVFETVEVTTTIYLDFASCETLCAGQSSNDEYLEDIATKAEQYVTLPSSKYREKYIIETKGPQCDVCDVAIFNPKPADINHIADVTQSGKPCPAEESFRPEYGIYGGAAIIFEPDNDLTNANLPGNYATAVGVPDNSTWSKVAIGTWEDDTKHTLLPINHNGGRIDKTIHKETMGEHTLRVAVPSPQQGEKLDKPMAISTSTFPTRSPPTLYPKPTMAGPLGAADVKGSIGRLGGSEGRSGLGRSSLSSSAGAHEGPAISVGVGGSTSDSPERPEGSNESSGLDSHGGREGSGDQDDPRDRQDPKGSHNLIGTTGSPGAGRDTRHKRSRKTPRSRRAPRTSRTPRVRRSNRSNRFRRAAKATRHKGAGRGTRPSRSSRSSRSRRSNRSNRSTRYTRGTRRARITGTTRTGRTPRARRAKR
ncbi:hypothetical protein B0I35DRAFT_265316 [Stachybotrys elegans]|uniref:Uncharacterized protein n=1 Tax=Stachybotrys elegans TaxID=80388 RepID=A0A8K0SKS5_9HYPO|nr:hypothetical protein B0I35DRAFT_265316 [Stachybotrys elegans]